jgi:hypothetical protein
LPLYISLLEAIGVESPGSPTQQTRDYHSFLLRIWREKSDNRWHMTIENPHTQERTAFGDLERFIQFLRDLTAQQGSAMDPEDLDKRSGIKG